VASGGRVGNISTLERGRGVEWSGDGWPWRLQESMSPSQCARPSRNDVSVGGTPVGPGFLEKLVVEARIIRRFQSLAGPMVGGPRVCSSPLLPSVCLWSLNLSSFSPVFFLIYLCTVRNFSSTVFSTRTALVSVALCHRLLRVDESVTI
jgi:hypothetical protein